MKVSTIPSMGNTVGGVDTQGSRVETIRALRMNTNATPGYAKPPETQDPPVSTDIVPNNEESISTVEATQAISPQFAALAKQKRSLQVKERELLDREKALETKSQGGDVISKADLKSRPLNALLDAGVTYDQLTEAILANQGNSEINELKSKLEAIEQGVEKRFVDRDTQQEQQLYSEVDRDIRSIVASKTEDFELVQKMGREPIAAEIWKREYKATGQFPDIEGILKDVEEHCLKECEEFAKLKKIQALFPQAAPQPPQRSQGMRTLTNKDTASVPSTAKQRAMAAFYGTLKK